MFPDVSFPPTYVGSQVRCLSFWFSIKRIGHVIFDGVVNLVKWGSYDVRSQ